MSNVNQKRNRWRNDFQEEHHSGNRERVEPQRRRGYVVSEFSNEKRNNFHAEGLGIGHRPTEQREHSELPIASSDNSVDEFGRAIQRKPHSDQKWPPRFESNGSSFKLDVRSGLFYEAWSNFFYNPTTKLYFSNDSKKYFVYDKASNPPFRETHDASKESVSEHPLVEPSLAPRPTPGTKPGISIKLKTKALKKRMKSKVPKVAHTEASSSGAQVERESDRDINKWRARQTDKQQYSKWSIVRTKCGLPLCMLCKRKFPSLEKLLVHERVSKMHQEKLVAKLTASHDDMYIDRAEIRRAQDAETATTDEVGPAATDGAGPSASSEGVGDSLLKKMGWNGEDSVRRSGSTTLAEKLKEDWTRMENLAKANGGS